MRGEVAVIGGGSVGAIENGKKVWQQVDQHLDQSAGRRRGGTMNAEMIVALRRSNKSGEATLVREQRASRERRAIGLRKRSSCTRNPSLRKAPWNMARFFPFTRSAARNTMVGDAP